MASEVQANNSNSNMSKVKHFITMCKCIFDTYMLRNDDGKILTIFIFHIRPLCFCKSRNFIYTENYTHTYNTHTHHCIPNIQNSQIWARSLRPHSLALYEVTTYNVLSAHVIKTKAEVKSWHTTQQTETFQIYSTLDFVLIFGHCTFRILSLLIIFLIPSV